MSGETDLSPGQHLPGLAVYLIGAVGLGHDQYGTDESGCEFTSSPGFGAPVRLVVGLLPDADVRRMAGIGRTETAKLVHELPPAS